MIDDLLTAEVFDIHRPPHGERPHAFLELQRAFAAPVHRSTASSCFKGLPQKGQIFGTWEDCSSAG